MIGDYEQYRDGDACNKGEQEFIYGLVKAVRPEVCVETGTHKGMTAIYIARGLEDNNKGHLYTVDPCDWGQEDIFDSLSPNLKKFITYQRIRGDELKVEGKIDFLFIDGFHGKIDVIEEIDKLFPQLNERALVLFHDCLENEENWHQGVLQALEEKKILNKTVTIPSLNWMRLYEYNSKDFSDLCDKPKRSGKVSKKPVKKTNTKRVRNNNSK